MEAAFEKEKEFIKSAVPTWKDLQAGDISFQVMLGGTRELYKVTASKEGVQPEIVLLRKFRPTSDPERNKLESYFFEILSSNGLSPRCFGQNEQCRVEEFLEGRTLTTKELTNKVLRRKLAMQLGRLHSLTLDKLDKKSNLVLNCIKMFPMIFQKKYENKSFKETDLEFIEEVKYIYGKEETEFIRSICSNEEDIVISHNDLWSTNVLFNEKTSEFTFIDLEGISYNFADFDLGKILLEPVFYRDRPTCTYELREDNFPSDEDIIDFLRYYLVSRKKGIIDQAHADSVARDPALLEELEVKLFPKKEDHDVAIMKLRKQVLTGVVVSSYTLAMALVAITSRDPTKEYMKNMDYFQWARDAHQLYKKFKLMLEKSAE